MAPGLESSVGNRRGIQSRLVFLLLCVFVPALLINAYITFDRLQSQRAHELQANLEMARFVSKAFEAFIKDVLHQELAIGIAITSLHPRAPEDIERQLGTHRDYTAIRDFSWVSPQGIFLYSSNPAMVGSNNSDRGYFRDIVGGREWVVGELILSRTTGKPVFAISRGIRDESGALLGVVVAAVIPERLDSVLSVERSRGASLALTDHRGMLVYRYPAGDVTWDERYWMRHYPELDEVLKGKEIVRAFHKSEDGEHRLVGITPIPSIGWAAIAGCAEEHAMEAAKTSMLFHVALFLTVMAAAFGATLLLSRRVAVSIRRLRDHALSLGSGELGKPVVISGGSELLDLADAFNSMAESVHSRESALQENEEWLRVTLSSIGDGVIATDTAARVTFVNPVASKLTGWEIEDALGQPVDAIFRIQDEKTGEPMEDPVQCVLREGGVLALTDQTTLVARDGRTLPIEDSAAPITDRLGSVLGVVLVFHDVSEKRKTRESQARLHRELERRASELQTVFDTAPIGLTIAQDPQGLHIRGNSVLEKMLGVVPRGELSKRASEPASFLVMREGRELAVEELPMQRAVRGEVVSGRILDVMRADGQWVTLHCSAAPLFDEDGRPRGAVGAFLDFTEIKRAQDALSRALNEAEEGRRTLETLMEFIPVGITIAEAPDLKIRMVSRCGRELLGAGHAGRTVEEVAELWRVYHQDGKTPMKNEDLPLSQAIRDGRVVKNAELVQVSAHGERLSLLCNAAPVRDSTGEILGGIVAWSEISEIRNIQNALRDSREDLNRAQTVGRIGSWRLNVLRNELLWSDENHRIFGIPKGVPLTYETFLGTIHPEDREYVHERWSAALQGEPYDIEHRIVLGESVRWVREKAELEFDHEGQLLGGFGTTQDITELKEAERALRESESRARLLSDTGGRLLSSENPEAIVQELCNRVMVHLDCQVFFNFLVDPPSGRLRLNAYAGIPAEEARTIEWLDYGVAVCGCAARDGIRIVAEDICKVPDPRADLVKSFGIQAYACHPLTAEDRVLGTLSFGTRTRPHFSDQDLALMKTVTDQVAIAMERVRLLGELHKSRDELETRVLDRTAELAEANRSLEAEIAERISAEKSLGAKHEQLRENEELLRTVLDALPVGVWITDGVGRILRANPTAQSIWRGARYVDLEDYGEYRGWWADTGEPIAAEEWALARAITRGEVSLNEVVDIQCFDGTRRTILNSAVPVRNDRGEIVRAIVVNQDITEIRKIETELRNSERRLRHNIELLQKVVDGITDPLIMLDSDGMVTMINKAAMDYYHVMESLEVLGKPCFEGLRGRDSACPECYYPFPAAESQAAGFERKGLSDPGRVEHVTVYPVFDDEGRREAVIVKISDITQAKILERQILQNEKLASLGLVTSGIAHEINNPNSFIHFNLPILKSYLEALLPIVDEYAALHPEFEVLHMSYDELRQDLFRLIENMEHGSQRISKIVGVLKSFVRKRDLEGMQQVDLRQLVDKVVALCHTEMRHKVRSFDVVVSKDLPLLFTDPDALEQVLLNLLINAIHACDKPDSHVILKVEPGPPGGDVVVMEITDNGSGIEESVRDRIFDPFFTTKSSTMGTGLGLYICHNHVTCLGGRIEVESSVGLGTTFRVVLPRTTKQHTAEKNH
jgi:PAS domain S-box-containing protein